MTRDEVIRLAREAGMEVHESKGQVRIGSAVLTGCDSTDQVVRLVELAVKHEREECAKVADAIASQCLHPDEIADAIRARSTDAKSDGVE